jgi:hypothetical protein
MNDPGVAIFMSVHLPASLKLDEINDTAAFYEKTVGPLAMMSVDNDLSLFRFAAMQPRPKNTVAIAAQVDGKSEVPDGQALVTTGRIFIEGKQVLCAATRAS